MRRIAEVEARLRHHLATIGEKYMHASDRDILALLEAVRRTREALTERNNYYQASDRMSMADHEGVRCVKIIAKALEGED